MKGDYLKSVSLMCSTCGGKEFEFNDDNGPIRCVCSEPTFNRDEFIHENGKLMESELDVIKNKVVSKIENDIAQIFKKLK